MLKLLAVNFSIYFFCSFSYSSYFVCTFNHTALNRKFIKAQVKENRKSNTEQQSYLPIELTFFSLLRHWFGLSRMRNFIRWWNGNCVNHQENINDECNQFAVFDGNQPTFKGYIYIANYLNLISFSSIEQQSRDIDRITKQEEKKQSIYSIYQYQCNTVTIPGLFLFFSWQYLFD